MEFEIYFSSELRNNKLVYYTDEHSFSIEGDRPGSFTSLLINDIQLQLDEDGNVIYVDGFCPILKFSETDKLPTNYKKAKLKYKNIDSLEAGISKRLNDHQRWPVYKNKDWICIGDPEVSIDLIEFSNGCLLGFQKENIVSLWLNPQIVD